MSSRSPDLGTLGLKAYLSISNIPAIIIEWSSLFPLVAHLANHGEENRMVGELALEGHLTVGLFPKLGYLDGLRRLLQGGADFLDRANSNSESTYRVWDVNWGSVFTRANGSAISLITEYVLRKQRPAMHLPDEVPVKPTGTPGTPGTGPASAVPQLQNITKEKSVFRRHQTLHIVRMSRVNHTRSVRGTILLLFLSHVGTVIYHMILLGVVVLLCFLGAYGSAVIVLNGLVSKFVCRLLRVKRPDGYLENNEHHDACMLSAVHENAQTWYLYIGDRGVVDWLLNKTMLASPPAGNLQMAYFRAAHILQLLAMTFVAAQKGLDGVVLVILLVTNYGFRYLFGGHKMARQWLEAEKVSVDAHSFIFSGRTPMIGAIHSLSQARDAGWMETLIAPCPRISAWLDEMNSTEESRRELDLNLQRLSSTDRSWVMFNSQLALQSVRLIRDELSRGKAMESLYESGSS